MTTQLIAERSSAPSLRDRALEANAELEAKRDAEDAADRERGIAEETGTLAGALASILGVDASDYIIVEPDRKVVAHVDGFRFTMRRPSWEERLHIRRLHVAQTCFRCGNDVWTEVDSLADLGVILSSIVEATHDYQCVEPEPLPATPPKPSACDRIEKALAAIVTAGEQCGLAHDRVTELLLQHPDVKAKAIAAMIGAPDPLKGDNGKHSAASAEKVVEQNAEYLAFRQLQRAAEVERWRALAAFKAAELRAKFEILKYDRAEGEA